MIEVDTHVFRGRVEVRHAKVFRPTSRLWEKWYWLPADTYVYSLSEILNVVPVEVPLLIDLKCFTRRAGRHIRDAIPPERPLVVSCRSWWVLAVFNRRSDTIRLRSCGSRWQLYLAQLIGGRNDDTGFVVAARLLDSRSIEALLHRSKHLYSWGVKSPDRLDELVEAGVTGVILDDLSLADRR